MSINRETRWTAMTFTCSPFLGGVAARLSLFARPTQRHFRRLNAQSLGRVCTPGLQSGADVRAPHMAHAPRRVPVQPKGAHRWQFVPERAGRAVCALLARGAHRPVAAGRAELQGFLIRSNEGPRCISGALPRVCVGRPCTAGTAARAGPDVGHGPTPQATFCGTLTCQPFPPATTG